jgi:hypothetical protein
MSGLSSEAISFLSYKGLINTLMPKMYQDLFKYSVCASQNTLNFHYIDKPVNAVRRNNRCLF